MPIGPMKLRRCPMGEFVDHDLAQHVPYVVARLRLVAEDVVEQPIKVPV